MVAKITKSEAGFDNIFVDGILIADCDLDKKTNEEEKLGEIIGMADEYDLCFRIYRTFAGLRPICVSDFFKSMSPISSKILDDLGSDYRYKNTVKKFKTFSCRISPKPNRIGIVLDGGFYSMLPRDQRAWTEKYNTACAGFKACDFILQTSECDIPSQIQNFVALHDEKSGCTLDLPLA
jgi:hypothetical protein